jgi:hypothetical protein
MIRGYGFKHYLIKPLSAQVFSTQTPAATLTPSSTSRDTLSSLIAVSAQHKVCADFVYVLNTYKGRARVDTSSHPADRLLRHQANVSYFYKHIDRA